MKSYCSDLFNYSRRESDVVKVGDFPMGGNSPIRTQTMTNTSTLDTKASVSQILRILKAGSDYVRLTAQGVREAENLKNIHEQLRTFFIPMIADIHFNPKAAEVAAQYVEAVRINPGNYVDSGKTSNKFDYTDEEYAEEVGKIREKFIHFLQICARHRTTVRIGVNHGSLSNRIMGRYGDTPEGMVASCMEFLRICKEVGFADVVISMKASNTLVMVQSVRLLIATMDSEDMHYPLHLGVTEAGDGEDGRIKSAVGIGALLADGIGDTVRVSLSEAPEDEIPVVKKLLAHYDKFADVQTSIKAAVAPSFDFYHYNRRKTLAVDKMGGGQVPVVVAQQVGSQSLQPDYICQGGRIGDAKIYTVKELKPFNSDSSKMKFLQVEYQDLTPEVVAALKSQPNAVLLLTSAHSNWVGEMRATFHLLMKKECLTPVVVCLQGADYASADKETAQLSVGADLGALLLDGFADGVMLKGSPLQSDEVLSILFGTLQAARVRVSKTEYISCPSCGRTLFDLQQTIAQIKAQTSQLKGLKIGIMGCIVNGPGEMADADYGYVGAGKGKVSLYKGKQCLEKNIPQEDAVNCLIELIKLNGDWK